MVPNMVANTAAAKIDLRFKSPSEAVRVDVAIRELTANPKDVKFLLIYK